MGEVVWTVNAEDVVNLGEFLSTGIFSPLRTVAVSGNSVEQPKYFQTIIGSELKPILKKAGIRNNENRIINGNVLTGSI